LGLDLAMPGWTEVPHDRQEAHVVNLLRQPVQGLGALEVLGRVVGVHEEPRKELGLEQRHAPNILLLQVAHRCRDEMAHAVTTHKKHIQIRSMMK